MEKLKGYARAAKALILENSEIAIGVVAIVVVLAIVL